MQKNKYLSRKGANNELEGVRIDTFYTFLYDVVPVLVFDALEDVAVQLTHNLLLLLRSDGLQGLLNNAAPVHLEC